ncbi:MAG: class I tRNA ligase family protein, partial [Acidimicrobiales bacterium]
MSAATDGPYPAVDKPDFPAIERRILDRWETDGTFQASIDQRPDDNEFVFYDGPPFANGLPHHGHLLTGFVKDVVPRYWTMRGYQVDRRFGWDCHGLPAEMETEKELGVSGHAAIAELGIARFNDACRESVMRYTSEWEETVTRQARWVDFENDYKTMDLPDMESVMWAFKELYDKGLVYEAYRVMPYSWGAETPLSNFEIRLDDATRPRQDPAITVAFDLTPADGDPGPMRILAWTTTPWTLPSNLALAVGPDVEYSLVEDDGTYVVIGSDALPAYAAQYGEATVHGTVRGADLVGRTYTPLFDYFSDRDDAFRVLGADFV